jgi:iron complex outermembrane receptor protein
MERSYGVNADINYRTKFADDRTKFQHQSSLLFIHEFMIPLILGICLGVPIYKFKNVAGHFDSRGMETNVKIGIR